MAKRIYALALGLIIATASPWLRPHSAEAADPDQAWATRLGGSSVASDYDPELAGIATDASGAIYVAGRTVSSDFRGGSNNASPNNAHKGGFDAYVAKLTPAGSLLWATFLGGSDNDYGTGIAIDTAGNVFVTGITYSATFSGGSNNGTPNNTHRGGDTDAFAAKLTADGALTWATFLGGSGPDEGCAIALDGSGNPYAAGSTMSVNFTGGSNNSGMNNAKHDLSDAFVVKLSPDGAMTWGTHLGGGDEDFGYGVGLDSSGNVYIAGETWSDDLSAGNNSYRGGVDGFLARVSSAGTLAWSTYLGGTGEDWASGLVIDGPDSIYLAGYTEGGFTGGSNNGAANNSLKGGSDAFAARMTTAGALTWATYLGGLSTDRGFAIAADGSGHIFVTGDTASNAFMGGSNNQTSANSYKGVTDGFAAKLTDAGAVSWACYLGGESPDRGRAIAADASGNAYVTGDTNSINFMGGDNDGGPNNSRKSSDDMFVSKLGSGSAAAPSQVTVTLKGEGTLNVTFEANGIDIARIELTGTDEKSSLTIKSKLKSTPVYLDELDVAGTLKGLKAKGIFLTGSLTATGGLGKVMLSGALPGSSIEAPWLSGLTIAGDFAGDIVLTGGGSPPKGLTLGKASVKGIVLGSVWHISGHVKSIKAGTWGAGSILAVGVDAGGDGVFFTGDDVTTGGSLGKVKYKYYATSNGGDDFGIIADEILKIKTPLPFVDGDFNIWVL